MTNHVFKFTVVWDKALAQQFSIDFVLASNASLSHIAELSKCLRAFVQVGVHGGFVEPTEAPHEGSLSLVSQDFGNPEKPRFLLEARSIDVRAFLVLQNLVARFSRRVHRVYGVEVRSLAPLAGDVHVLFPPLTWDNAHDLYPGLSSFISVRVQIEDPQDYHKGRRCVVEFQQPEVREKLELLREWINHWATIVELGGYSLPVREAHEAEAWVDVLQIYDEYSVEVVFSLFEAAEEAWKPLINLLDRFSIEIGSLALVSVE
ncbi:hypothetical protein C8R32_10452 [Nitrosospira sp. Nsp5]|uniref:Uncharacterized protein n=1 Tax=Nitrosospira multiformis TaxID=1231 RepID=A0ABY0TEJ3_9PROT|nr:MULTISPECIES: hypothetical protein [Nitrosospira]PTR08973.1 hypothetical protein C8R32_10452 [Nitrosospira sp. Nsp5]SDQ68148.1 hypothetical protein SAMN05216402_1831 [Nitrosospira multiformis]